MTACSKEFSPVREIERECNDHDGGLGLRRLLSTGGNPLAGCDVVNDPGIGINGIVWSIFLPDFEGELFHCFERHAGIEAGCFETEVETLKMISQAKWLMGEGSCRFGDSHAEADRAVKDRDFRFSRGYIFAIEIDQILHHVGSSLFLIRFQLIAGETGGFIRLHLIVFMTQNQAGSTWFLF